MKLELSCPTSKPSRSTSKVTRFSRSTIMTRLRPTEFWLSKKVKARRVFQGIDDADALKLRVDSKGATGDAGKTAVAKTFGNRFRFPIDFELLNDIGPYHQVSLVDKLEIKLTFNDKKAIIMGSTTTLAAAADAYDFTVTDIRTEWNQITSLGLSEFSDNAPSKSMSKIVILAVDPDDRKQFVHTEKFKNLDITKVNIGIEGVEKVNALCASGIQTENTHDHVSLRDFLTENYGAVTDPDKNQLL